MCVQQSTTNMYRYPGRAEPGNKCMQQSASLYSYPGRAEPGTKLSVFNTLQMCAASRKSRARQ